LKIKEDVIRGSHVWAAVIVAAFICFCFSCNRPKQQTVGEDKDRAAVAQPDTTVIKSPADTVPVYANERFRNVVVSKTGSATYRVTGEGRIFEAVFNWTVEDGHHQLAKGFQSTSAGAPAWGKFDFNITAKKATPNTTLHLILFEYSAADGSIQHELMIPLK
jgi:hypothetical protein